MRSIQILPSLLGANCLELGKEVRAVEKAGADGLHIDVMDGHFVPNLAFAPDLIRALHSFTSLPLDVHLMIEPVAPYLETFLSAGADTLTFHCEAVSDPLPLLKTIRDHGKKAGLSLKPATPSSALLPYLDHLDQILVMTVEPGFGGQNFQPQQLEKIKELASLIADPGRAITLEVDGGINLTTAPLCIEAGATHLVAGKTIFAYPPTEYGAIMTSLRTCTPIN